MSFFTLENSIKSRKIYIFSGKNHVFWQIQICHFWFFRQSASSLAKSLMRVSMRVFLISDCSFCWSSKSIFDQDVIGFIGLRNIANWNVDVGVLARYCLERNVRIIDDWLSIFQAASWNAYAQHTATHPYSSLADTRHAAGEKKNTNIFFLLLFFLFIFQEPGPRVFTRQTTADWVSTRPRGSTPTRLTVGETHGDKWQGLREMFNFLSWKL